MAESKYLAKVWTTGVAGYLEDTFATIKEAVNSIKELRNNDCWEILVKEDGGYKLLLFSYYGYSFDVPKLRANFNKNNLN